VGIVLLGLIFNFDAPLFIAIIAAAAAAALAAGAATRLSGRFQRRIFRLLDESVGVIIGLFRDPRALFSITLFAEWLFYLLTTSTVFIFRRREPNAARPYKVWGYPVVPAVFVLASAVLLYYTLTQNVRNSVFGTLVMLAGIPVYFIFASQRENANRG
jgi:amino acid transporter